MGTKKTHHASQPIKSITTTKDKTMAIETRAGILQNEMADLKAHIYLQYMGKEFSTADIMDQGAWKTAGRASQRQCLPEAGRVCGLLCDQ